MIKATKSPKEAKSKNTKTTSTSNSQASISSSIEETYKKVTSVVVPSIQDHISSTQFDSRKDGLDFLEVCM
jgi:hypothetical protein